MPDYLLHNRRIPYHTAYLQMQTATIPKRIVLHNLCIGILQQLCKTERFRWVKPVHPGRTTRSMSWVHLFGRRLSTSDKLPSLDFYFPIFASHRSTFVKFIFSKLIISQNCDFTTKVKTSLALLGKRGLLRKSSKTVRKWGEKSKKVRKHCSTNWNLFYEHQPFGGAYFIEDSAGR